MLLKLTEDDAEELREFAEKHLANGPVEVEFNTVSLLV